MPSPFLSSEEYDERAHQLYNEGNYEAALSVLREGLGLYPNAVELHVGVGYARLARDEFAWARRAFEELLARVEALGRRPKQVTSPVLTVGDLRLDSATRQVTRSGHPIELTPKEYAVLEYLMRHADRVMSRTLITEYAWDYHFDPGTNVVDVVINRLRKKVDSGHRQKLIHTVRGVGYVVKAGA